MPFIKNQPPWNKGKKLSTKHRKKLSVARMGKTPWNKGKRCLYMMGNTYRLGLVVSNETKHKQSISVKNFYTKNPDSRKKQSDIMLGKNTWMKGKKLSEKTRNKMSDSRLGKKHWNWQGGLVSENERQRKSKEYKMWRQEVFKRDDWACQECGERGGVLNADHIKPFSLFSKFRLELSNGRTLCISCHKKTDTYGSKVRNYGIIIKSNQKTLWPA